MQISEDKNTRVELFQQYYNIYPSIQHSFLNYDRYQEAEIIINELGDQKIIALDFGCGVGDYGMAFLRHGWDCHFYDKYEEMLDFVYFRYKNENEDDDDPILFKGDYQEIIGEYDLVVFGEVLEHMDDAFDVLKSCVDQEVKYIWTSSYPFIKDDSVFKRRGHSEKAGEDRHKCQELLLEHYDFKQFDGQKRLWTKK